MRSTGQSHRPTVDFNAHDKKAPTCMWPPPNGPKRSTRSPTATDRGRYPRGRGHEGHHLIIKVNVVVVYLYLTHTTNESMRLGVHLWKVVLVRTFALRLPEPLRTFLAASLALAAAQVRDREEDAGRVAGQLRISTNTGS